MIAATRASGGPVRRATRLRSRASGASWVAAVLAALALQASGCMNHYLIYPDRDPPGMVTWSEDVTRGALRVHLEWASPPGSGPFPAVIVHPPCGERRRGDEGRDRATSRSTATWRSRSTTERLMDGQFRRTTFSWREPSDHRRGTHAGARRAAGRSGADRRARVLAGRDVQPADGRVRAGHQGGGGLLSASPISGCGSTPSVATGRRRIVFRVIEWHFRRESGAASDAEFEEMLRLGSAMTYVDALRAPILLVHGADDTIRAAGRVAAPRARAPGSRARRRAPRRAGRRARVQLQGAGPGPACVGRDPGLAAHSASRQAP